MDLIQQKFNNPRQTRLLSAHSKRGIRHNLQSHLTLHPIVVISFWQRLRVRSSSPLMFIPTLVILILLAGAGTAVAANGALPGQFLYQVKTQINEPVRAALTLQADDRAVYETELATTRIEEAHTLAAQGQLNDQTAAQLSTNLQTHVQNIKVNNQSLQEAHDLLEQADEKLRDHDYNSAVELGHQASDSARHSNGSDKPVEKSSGDGEGGHESGD